LLSINTHVIILNLGEIWKYQLSNYAPVWTEGRMDRIGSKLEKSIDKKSLKHVHIYDNIDKYLGAYKSRKDFG
jgi:hypothetical protein